MNSLHLILVCGVMLGLCGADATADDYFVRQTGSDSNSGLAPGSAFRTIDRAADAAQAGDTVYVGAGTYNEMVTPPNDGTAANPIRFVADTTGVQTGDGGEVTISGATCISVINSDYIHFSGFRIAPTRRSVVVKNRNSTGFVLNNCQLVDAFVGVYQPYGGSTTLTGCTLTGTGFYGVYANDGTMVIEKTTIDSARYYPVVCGYRSGSVMTVTNSRITGGYVGVYGRAGSLTVTNSIVSGQRRDAIWVRYRSGTLNLYNSTIGNTNGYALRTWGSAVVRNSIFFNIGSNVFAGSSGGLVDASNCLFHDISGTIGATVSEAVMDDPLFVDEAGMDLRLTVDSPAIDAGVDGSAWTGTDIDGTERPTGDEWDIGAYEYTDPRVYAGVPYITDFESGAGVEWSGRSTSTLTAFTEFLGRFGEQDSSTLYVDGMTGGETYYLFFDVFVIDDVEGSGTYQDDFLVSIDGSSVLSTTFDNVTGSQLYPGSPSQSGSNLGYSSVVDSIYRRVYIPFVSDDDRAVIRFDVDMTASVSSESFGIDNVMVLSEDDAQAYLPIFTDVSVSTGFDIQNDSATHSASGLLWGDIDRDGDLDAVVTGLDARYLRYDAATRSYSAQVLGPSGNVRRQGALLDVDGDGDLDFWAVNVASYNKERLFASNGGSSLSNVGSVGMSAPRNNEGVAAGDVNGDGRTDLVMFSENGNWIGINTGEDPVRFDATADSSDGLTGRGLAGNGELAAGADVNNDGFPDFFYHYAGGKLFQSKGDGTYRAANRGISVRTGNSYKSGSAFGDYDNDGDMDLFSPSYKRNEAGFLHKNTGITDVVRSGGETNSLASFVNVASAAGLDSTARQRSGAWGDFDNDGDLDLLITTDTNDPLLLYENQGDGTFLLVDKGAAISGEMHDAVFVDFDNDGDLDISVTRAEGDTNVLLENSTDDDRYLKVRLVQPGDNGALVDVVGARVELWNAGGTSILARRDIGVARGFGGIEPLWAHFGGVDPLTAYTVKVVWPGGTEMTQVITPGGVSTTFGSVTVAQMLTMVNQETARARVIRWREVSSVDE